jgi:hypothetical protein
VFSIGDSNRNRNGGFVVRSFHGRRSHDRGDLSRVRPCRSRVAPAHPRALPPRDARPCPPYRCESARVLRVRVPALRIRPSCRRGSLTWTSACRYHAVNALTPSPHTQLTAARNTVRLIAHLSTATSLQTNLSVSKRNVCSLRDTTSAATSPATVANQSLGTYHLAEL